jgi:GTP-binding protein
METSYVKSVFDARELPRDRLPEIAVAGKSNVGKSTLLNKVMGRRGLAKTSRTPGKTRCLNYYLVEPDKSKPFYFVDLPGYGYAKVAKTMRRDWGALIEKYLEMPERPIGLMALFDARRDVDMPEQEWLEWLRAWGRPFLVVLTKSDKLSGNERSRSRQRWTSAAAGVDPVMFSSVTAQGKDKLWQWIDDVRLAAVRR